MNAPEMAFKKGPSTVNTPLASRAHFLPKYGFGHVVDLIKNCEGRSHQAFWLPGHGKKENWKPPTDEYGSARFWRKLNDVADKQADIAKKKAMRRLKIRERRQVAQEAKQWSSGVMRRLSLGISCYIGQDPQLVAKWGDALRDRIQRY